MNRTHGLLRNKFIFITLAILLATCLTMLGGRVAHATELPTDDQQEQVVPAGSGSVDEGVVLDEGEGSVPDGGGTGDVVVPDPGGDPSSDQGSDQQPADPVDPIPGEDQGTDPSDPVVPADEDVVPAADGQDPAAAAATETETDPEPAPAAEAAATPAPKTTAASAPAEAPASNILNGVDISGWNPGVDFNALKKAGTSFVIIKATEWNPRNGSYTSFNDYKSQANAALKAGLMIGFYHFFTSPSKDTRGTAASINSQVDGFVSAIASYLNKGDKSPVLVLDWENTDYSNIESHVDWAKKWLDAVYDRTGVRPLIYMNKSCSNSYNWTSVAADYDLWGAMYLSGSGRDGQKYGKTTYTPSADYSKYGNWGKWGSKPTMYQYASSASISGHGSNPNIDVNVFYGNAAAFRKLAQPTKIELSNIQLENGAIYRISTLRDLAYGLVDGSGNVKLSDYRNYRTGYWRVEKLANNRYRFYNVGTGKALALDDIKKGANAVAKAKGTVFRLVKCFNGSIALIPEGANDLRLDVKGAQITTYGANVDCWTYNGGYNQRFFFTKQTGLTEAYKSGANLANGAYAFESALKSKLYADVQGRSTANNANIIVYQDKRQTNQRFYLEKQGNGLYKLIVFSSNKLLEANGGNVRQNANNSMLSELWYFVKSGSSYKIKNAATGKLLDVSKSSTKNSTNVGVYKATDGKNQLWNLKKDNALTEAYNLSNRRPFENGVYSITSALNANYVLDLQKATRDNKGNVVIYTSNNGLNQKFQLAYVGNGLYRIRAAHSLLNLDVQGGSTKSGANVIQYSPHTDTNQLWYFVPNGSGYSMKSAGSGNSLNVNSSKAKNSANVNVTTPGTQKHQRWVIEKTGLFKNGDYAFSSGMVSFGLMLEIADSSKNPGAKAQVWQLTGKDNQKFKLTYLGKDKYTIQSVKSGLYLEVANASGANSAKIQQGKKTGKASQQWKITMNDDGSISVMNVNSSLYLDVQGAKVGNGKTAIQYKSTGKANQRWNIVPASYLPDPDGKLGQFVSKMAYWTVVGDLGYDMGNRWDVRNGGETDCSALVITCLKRAGFAVGDAVYTGNMSSNLTSRGWVRLKWDINNVRPGDILLNDLYHTAAVIAGYGKNAWMAQASINENGEGWGGKGGDQTGMETNVKRIANYGYGGWDCILRYVG